MNLTTVNGFSYIEKKGVYWVSGLEICRRLGYEFPKGQATKIWQRHKNSLASHSVVTSLASTDSKKYDTRIYDETGARFFITKCHKPLADEMTLKMIEGFIKLRDEVITKKEHRDRGSSIYRGLTDQLMNLKEDETSRAGSHIYQNLAKNNCKVVTGMSPAQLREARGVKSTRDGLTLAESIKLSALELYQAEHLKNQSLTPKEAYSDLKAFSGQFIDVLNQIEQ